MTGRPTTYTAELADMICERLAAGESLRSICAPEGMPSESAVRGWADRDHDGFRTRYDRAREHQAHALVDEILDIARTETDAGLGRMRIDALKWTASKILPKAYGDKQQVEHSGGVTLSELIAQSYEIERNSPHLIEGETPAQNARHQPLTIEGNEDDI